MQVEKSSAEALRSDLFSLAGVDGDVPSDPEPAAPGCLLGCGGETRPDDERLDEGGVVQRETWYYDTPSLKKNVVLYRNGAVPPGMEDHIRVLKPGSHLASLLAFPLDSWGAMVKAFQISGGTVGSQNGKVPG